MEANFGVWMFWMFMDKLENKLQLNKLKGHILLLCHEGEFQTQFFLKF